MAARKQRAEAAPVAVEPEVVTPAEREAQELATTAKTPIDSFFSGLVPFFRTAAKLEDEAGAMLARARNRTAPTSAEEDEAIQKDIRAAKTHVKVITDHWTITGTFHTLHKRLVAGRGRGEKLAEDAAAINQRLHNAYVDEQEKKAREEARRRQEELDRQAEAERQRELDELEAAAVQAEAGTADLSDRESQFVSAYTSNVTGWRENPTRAAEVAGFRNPAQAAARLMASPKILQALEAARKASAIRQQAAAVKAQPVIAEQAEPVKPEVSRAAGVSDRVTWRGEIYDEAAFVQAVISGRFGIPLDVLTFKQAKVTELAQSMNDGLNRIPGARAVKNRSTV